MAQQDREGGVAPVQVRGTVLTVRRVDAYMAMTMVAPAIAMNWPGRNLVAIAGATMVMAMYASTRRTVSTVPRT